MFYRLQSLIVGREAEDIFSWRESKNDKFSVRSLYYSYARASEDLFPFSIRWWS